MVGKIFVPCLSTITAAVGCNQSNGSSRAATNRNELVSRRKKSWSASEPAGVIDEKRIQMAKRVTARRVAAAFDKFLATLDTQLAARVAADAQKAKPTAETEEERPAHRAVAVANDPAAGADGIAATQAGARPAPEQLHAQLVQRELSLFFGSLHVI